MTRISKTAVSQKDLKRFAKNVAEGFQETFNRGASLAVCFDALVSVLDGIYAQNQLSIEMNGTDFVSKKLHAELERRKQLSLPQTKPPEETPVASP